MKLTFKNIGLAVCSIAILITYILKNNTNQWILLIGSNDSISVANCTKSIQCFSVWGNSPLQKIPLIQSCIDSKVTTTRKFHGNGDGHFTMQFFDGRKEDIGYYPMYANHCIKIESETVTYDALVQSCECKN